MPGAEMELNCSAADRTAEGLFPEFAARTSTHFFMLSIHAGDCAEVQITTAPRRTFTGEVESVSWGVSELPKLSITGLPVVKRELDWVQLAQDFPVRIRFTESVPPDLLRVGAIATATIFTRPDNEEW